MGTLANSAMKEHWKRRWTALCQGKNASKPEETFSRLWSLYHESHRAYHNFDHVAACLSLMDECGAGSWQLEIAIWFHDAVYNPRRGDNEEQSARLALEAYPDRDVERLILHTKSHAAPGRDDEAWMGDIDLAILGAPENEYDRYEAAIRSEYKWVPWFRYRRKRREILESFLERDPIYHTEWFRARREATARENLRRTLKR